MMIDDYDEAMDLMEKMQAQLPIPARPTSAFVRAMRQHGVTIAHNQELSIKNVFYMGDPGGISCEVTPPGMEKMPIVTSITHIRIQPGHPLAAEIRAYQTKRSRRLAQTGEGKPTSFVIEPRRKRRR
jgi:hypothetical protein